MSTGISTYIILDVLKPLGMAFLDMFTPKMVGLEEFGKVVIHGRLQSFSSYGIKPVRCLEPRMLANKAKVSSWIPKVAMRDVWRLSPWT
jgi:hypothetical protein